MTPNAPATHSPPPPALAKIAHFQTAISLALLALLLLLFAAADLVSRSARINDFFSNRELAANDDHGTYHIRRGVFFDENDYFWYRLQGAADYSRGGVSFFGASTTNYAFDAGALPGPESSLIHNYGYSGATLTQVAQLIDYLIHHHGLLAAAPERNLFVIGFCFFDVEGGQFAGAFPESVQRSGIRQYDPADGITDLDLSPPDRFIRLERARARSVALRMLLGQHTTPIGPIDPTIFRAHLAQRLGPNWPADLQTQMAQVNQLLDELAQSHVETRGILLPLGSWCDGNPLRVAFWQQLQTIFAEHQMPLIDCTHAVPDDGFRDPYHLNTRGDAIMQNFFLQPALEFLRSKGML